MIPDGRLEQRFELGLILGGDEGKPDIRDLVGRLRLGSLRLRLGIGTASRLERGGHGAEARRLGHDGRGGLGLGLGGSLDVRAREGVLGLELLLLLLRRRRRRLLLLLLLVELLLVLLRDLRHRRDTRLEGLLLLRLSGESGILLLQGLWRLLLRHAGVLLLEALRARIAGILLVQRRRGLAKTSRLRREGTLLLLLLRLARTAGSAHAERLSILLLLLRCGPWPEAVTPAEEGIGIGIHSA